MTDGNDLLDMSERFYAAVRAVLSGEGAPMLAVWSHSDEASYCDTRGEIVVGWPALEAYWRRAAAINVGAPAPLSATGQVKHAVVVDDLAYVVTLEEVRRESELDGMTARATLIYRRERDVGWRLLHRHADAAPKTMHQPPDS